MLPGIIAAFAFIVSIFAGTYCKFISFTSTNNDGNDPITLYFGIWNYQGWSVVNTAVQGTVILETCHNYPSGTKLDSDWRSARAFSTLALIIGGIVTFWALLVWCIYPTKQMYNAGGILFVLCCLFQGLSLLLTNSEACRNLQPDLENSSIYFQSACSMAMGAYCAIAATVLWFVAAIAAWMVDPPVRPPITTQTHDVTYTKTTNGADGAAVMSENVVRGEPVAIGGRDAEKAV